MTDTPTEDAEGPECYDALHLAWVFHDMVKRHLVNHPAIKAQSDLQVKAKVVAQLLADLHADIRNMYQ